MSQQEQTQADTPSQMDRIEAMLREVLEILRKSQGTAGQGGGLGH